MQFFDGLQSYEVVLLILGVVLFFALVFLLIYMVMAKRTYTGLFPFLVIPVVMVGFPGIQKVRFDGKIVEIETLAAKAEQAPANTEVKKELESKLQKVEGKRVTSSRALRILEKAHTLVGNEEKARFYRERLPTAQRDVSGPP